jgi:hypothetical protein
MHKEASCQQFFWIMDNLITQSVMIDFSSRPMVCGRRNNTKFTALQGFDVGVRSLVITKFLGARHSFQTEMKFLF